jgi:hypothetical protein
MSKYIYKPAVTTTSGTWTGDTMPIFGGICCQLYVKAASTATFDLTVTDSDGVEVRKVTDIDEVFNDLTKWPVQGVYTLMIGNATVDEDFTVLMSVEEF